MASFDLHDKCARCRDKLISEDDCVKDKPCKVCDGFSDIQKEMLATPSYKIRKDKKAGLLVSPKEVTVLQPVDLQVANLRSLLRIPLHFLHLLLSWLVWLLQIS